MPAPLRPSCPNPTHRTPSRPPPWFGPAPPNGSARTARPGGARSHTLGAGDSPGHGSSRTAPASPHGSQGSLSFWQSQSGFGSLPYPNILFPNWKRREQPGPMLRVEFSALCVCYKRQNYKTIKASYNRCGCKIGLLQDCSWLTSFEYN